MSVRRDRGARVVRWRETGGQRRRSKTRQEATAFDGAHRRRTNSAPARDTSAVEKQLASAYSSSVSECSHEASAAARSSGFGIAKAVVNAGAARFLDGGPISMTAEDVIATARHTPYATVVAVHLEALNQCPMTRAELRRHLVAAGLAERVHTWGWRDTAVVSCG